MSFFEILECPFGMIMPGRNYRDSVFRFGFNNQEKDDEIYGVGNATTAMFWEYDSRLGRRWNKDPKPIASVSPYTTFENNPIWHIDPNGDSIGISLFEKGESSLLDNEANTFISNPKADGNFVIFSHANADGLQYSEKGHKQLAQSAKEVVTVLLKNPDFKKALKDGTIRSITLLGCNTGSNEFREHDGRIIKRSLSIAQNLSLAFPDVKIIAADGYILHARKSGENTKIVGVENYKYQGGFVTLLNGKIISKKPLAYNSKTGTSVQKDKIKY